MGSGHLLSCSLCSQSCPRLGCVLELPAFAGPGLRHLQTPNLFCASPNAAHPNMPQDAPRQCGPSGKH